jgi:mono/diheme cytochrome c family protein
MKTVKILLFLPALIALNVYGYNLFREQDVQKKNDPATMTGEQTYTKYCLTCHQVGGTGVRNMFPPLTGNENITAPSKELITIVLFGLTGPIVVNGMEYDQVMPAQDYLTDKQIADVLTFIRSSWGNKASPVKPEEVSKIRKEGKPPE